MAKMRIAGQPEKSEPVIEWYLSQCGDSVVLNAKGKYNLAVLVLRPTGDVELVKYADQPGIKTDEEGKIVIANP